MAAVKKTVKFDQQKGVRKLARERVGTVPPARLIEPKDKKKPKHKKQVQTEE